MIIVDSSALVAILLRLPTAKALEVRVLGFGGTLHAPHLIDVEVASVVRRLTFAGVVDARRASEALADLTEIVMKRYPHDVLIPRVWALRDDLTAYDATYVALAENLNAPLITRDKRLANAAGSKARIEVF